MALQEVKLCLLGDSGVGKSSLAYRFVHDNFRPAMESTIGASFLTKTLHVDGRALKFQIWDTAGQEKYRALAPMYYRGSAVAIVVYDVTRMETFRMLKTWISELSRHGPINIVLAIAGNKADLAEQRQVEYDEAFAYAEEVGAIFVETSAKTATNISAMFHAISLKLLVDDSVTSETSTHKSDTIKVAKDNAQHEQKKKRCC